MERRLAVPARATRRNVSLAIAALVVATSTVHAAPKRKDARKAFDRGVALYKKKDFAAARDALAASAKLESDVETLFAWAQAERQLGNCEQAIALYEQLLDMEMPSANKQAIRPKLDECKQILAANQPPPEAPPVPDPEPASPPETALEPPERSVPERPERERLAPTSGGSSKHLVGGSLLGIGAIGLVIGSYFLYTGRQADLGSRAATNYFEFIRLREDADTYGTRGVIAAGVGGAFVVAGIIWYATRSATAQDDGPVVSGWVGPQSAGVCALGHF